ncbi:MAG: hypothetical protein WC709_00850 [Thermoleophilia bacterium]
MGFTWVRLFVGMDLQSESFYVLVPWRWALGDRPFVDEQSLVQIPGLLTYPLLKVFGMVRHYDPTGLMLYMRHWYLVMMLGVAMTVFLLLRRLVRWELALPVASLFVTFMFFATPQLSYNSMAMAFLVAGAATGAWVVIRGKSRRYALASGAAFAVAVAAYPPLLFVAPFCAACFVFAQGRRTVGMVAGGAFGEVPDPEASATGTAARQSLGAWLVGALVVLVPFGLLLLSFGPGNLLRSYRFTVGAAHELNELGGAGKVLQVSASFWWFLTSRPYMFVAALVIYLIYRRWPRVGRALLAALPLALWLAAQRPMIWASGYVCVFAFLSPYLYLFLPSHRRVDGARLLIWVWPPAMLAGAMTAYTSASGFANAAVGFAPAVMLSGLFLAWSLEAVTGGGHQMAASRAPWLALAVLVAIVGVTVAFQLRFQQVQVPYRELTSRFTSGPWWGVKVTPQRRALMDRFGADLKAQARGDDRLLVIYDSAGFLLYWNGKLATNTYWIDGDAGTGRLDATTIDYFKRHRLVPTLVVQLTKTKARTPSQLAEACGGLEYPSTLIRRDYVFHRKPAGETTDQVLQRLSPP